MPTTCSSTPAHTARRLPLPQYAPLLLALALLWLMPLTATAQSITDLAASDDLFEDRVELSWAALTPNGNLIQITRDGEVIAAVAETTTRYDDATGEPGITYEYCLTLSGTDGGQAPVCDTGRRLIFRPTGFAATDATLEDLVFLSWSDRSTVEAAYLITRGGETTAAGSALSLDGIDDYAEVPVNGAHIPAEALTVEAWVNLSNADGDVKVVGNGNLETEAGYVLGVSNNAVFAEMWTSDGAYTSALGGTVPNGTWVHIAMTWAPNDALRAYVDGVEVGSTPTGPLGIGNALINPLRIGVAPWNVNQFPAAGRIDEVRLWSTRRTAERLQTYAKVPLTGRETGLVAYYPFDEGSGITAEDAAGDSDATLLGGAAWGDNGPVLDLATLATLAPNTTAYADSTADEDVDYTYCVAAVDADGFASLPACDVGRRAVVTPPGDVAATDGQFEDRVRITWTDASADEDEYVIYRDGAVIGTVAANSASFDDLTATPLVTYEYCVEAVMDELSSIQVCDTGMAGGLAPPEALTASVNTFDDRVQLDWTDPGDAEDGFIVLREPAGSGTLTRLATLGAGAEQYNDFTAAQAVPYTYHVQAYSLAAAPDTTFSEMVAVDGTRSAVLAPTAVAATAADYEDRVELSWQNPSTTAMLFKLYRVDPASGDTVFIASTPPAETLYADHLIGSDVNHTYCVTSYTVTTTAAALQGAVAQQLTAARWLPTAFKTDDGTAPGAIARLQADHARATWEQVEATILRLAAGTQGDVAETAKVCAVGSRSIHAPQPVAATYDAAEDHVNVTWADPSEVNTGFVLYRGDGTVHLDGVDGYVDLPDALAEAADFTFEAWFRWDGSTAWQRLLDFGQSTVSYLYLTPMANTAGTPMQFAITTAGSGNEQRLTTASATPGAWTHVAVVLDGDTGRLYINGTMVDEQPITLDPTDVGATNTWLGRSQFNDPFFAGRMRDVRLWHVARTDFQIAANVNTTLTGDEDGLAAYWPMTDGGGDRAFDVAGNHHGTLIDGASLGEQIADLTGSRASYEDHTGTPGVAYTYGVAAVDDHGTSQVTTDVGFRKLLAPTAAKADQGTSETTIKVSWADNSRAEDGYHVYRRQAADADSALIATVTTNAYTDVHQAGVNDLMVGEDYVYSIVAFDDHGTSAAATATGRTMIQPPGSVNASTGYESEVVVTWSDDSILEDGYEVRRDGGVLGATAPDETTFTDATAVAGVTYTYCVRSTAGPAFSSDVCADGYATGPPPAASTTNVPIVTVSGAPGESDDLFGNAVAIDGDWAVIGAPADDSTKGSAYFFKRSGGTWKQQDKVSAVGDTDTSPPYFGGSVDISGDFAIIGAWLDEDGKGAAFIYERKGNTWELAQKLTANDGVASDGFGIAVAIDGEWAIIGAPFRSDFRGSTFMFQREFDGTWTQKAEYAPVLEGLFLAGSSVDVNGEWFVSGAPVDTDQNTGALNVGCITFYKRSDESFPDLADGPCGTQPNERFGSAVALGDGWAVASAPNYDLPLTNTASSTSQRLARALGASRLTVARSPGTRGDLSATDPARRARADSLIQHLRTTGGVPTPQSIGQLLASAASGATTDQGRALFFKRDGDDWVATHEVIGADGDNLGAHSVALRGERALINVDNGLNGIGQAKLMAYEAENDIWRLEQTFQSSTSFGRSVALDEDWGVMGHRFGENENGVDTGVAYFESFLVDPSDVAASDQAYDDRVRVSWKDQSQIEAGYTLYRNGEPLVTDLAANTTSYNDFQAEPGTAYEYCVVAVLGDKETGRVCDFGMRPPNGGITGRVATVQGAGLGDVDVCLTPNPNRGLLLDGAGSHVATAATLSAAEALSAEAWVKLSNANGDVKVVGNTDNAAGFALGVSSHLVFAEVWDSLGVITYLHSGSVPNGTWTHIAMTWAPDDALRIYVDGVEAGSTATGPDLLGASPNPVVIGALPWDVSQFVLAGQVDEVRLWSSQRTAAQLQAAMQTPLAGDEAGLLAYWPLDQDGGAIAPDLTANPSYGRLIGGAYFSDEGAAPVATCAVTNLEGNYTLEGIRYGASTTFTVTPTRANRSLAPAFKEIILSTESPVQNEVDFIDQTAFTVAGTITFEGTTCPVPEVDIFVNDVLKGQSEADGTYAVSVDPSIDADDLRVIRPQRENARDAADPPHVFAPAEQALFVGDDTFGIDFADQKTRTLSGFYGGSCDTDIGTATLKITTQDGCYDQEVALTGGAFTVQLPPQQYLLQVVVDDVANPDLAADVIAFFEALGTQEIDLTAADTTRDFIYRAPLKVTIEGFPASMCSTITQSDEDGNVVHDLPVVPLLTQNRRYPLTIRVDEDYGGGVLCPADTGAVTIYDNIAEQEGEPVVIALEDGKGLYETTAVTPNVFGGARVDGVNRSFQKFITTEAAVPDRDAVQQTDWVIVEGVRPRTATFVTVPSDPIPMWVVHDPPGDNSYSYIEAGSTVCTGFTAEEAFKVDTELLLKESVGIEFVSGVAFGGLWGTNTRTRFDNVFQLDVGAGGVFEDGWTACMTTTEAFKTSGSPLFVGRDADVFVGMGLNYIFAEADELLFDDAGASCTIEIEDALAMGINLDDPIHTTFQYTRGLIEDTMVPQLEENAAREETGSAEQVQQQQAADRWRTVLAYDAALQDGFELDKNHSFNAGADVSQAVSYSYEEISKRAAVQSIGTQEGFSFDLKALGAIGFSLDLTVKTKTDLKQAWSDTEADAFNMGYVLADDDLGDFFTVDVGHSNCEVLSRTADTFELDCDGTIDAEGVERPPFIPGGEMIFNLRSGRTSNPWEPGPNPDAPLTQPRDGAALTINPPVQTGVAPDGPATFTLTLTNESESQEAREYVLRTVHTSNPGGAVLSAQGGGIQGGLAFFLDGDPTKASQEVTLNVTRGPNQYAYEDLQVILYPPGEYALWQDGAALQRADTVTFSVFFEAPCSDISILRPHPFWSLNAATYSDSLEVILHEFMLDVSESDAVDRLGLEYRLAGTPDWLPAVDVPAGGLADDATSWSARWLPPADGDYEVRAFTTCPVGGSVYSDPLPGLVDTAPPVVFGTPAPADQVLALGSDIAVTFDEAVDCASVVTDGAFVNTEVRFLDGDGLPGAGVPITAACDGRTVILTPTDAFDWGAAENQRLEARLLTGIVDGLGSPVEVVDLAGNPIGADVAWSFTVQRSAVTWRPGSQVVETQRFLGGTFTAALVNGRAEDAAFILTDVAAWLTPSVSEGALPPGGEVAVGFTVDPTLDIGVHAHTVRAAVTVGGEVLDVLLYVTVSVLDQAQQAIVLNAGWTWFSINRQPPGAQPDSVLASLAAQGGDLVKSQAAFSLYDAGSGAWVGSLMDVHPGPAYQIKLSSGGTLLIDGPAADPAMPIAIDAGWNWLGYLPQVALPVAEALGSTDDTYVPTEGDVLKSQTAFEVYTASAWVPGTMVLTPGHGYMLMAAQAGELIYPDAVIAPDGLATAIVPQAPPAATARAGTMQTAERATHRPEPEPRPTRAAADEPDVPVEAQQPEVAVAAPAYAHSMTVVATVLLDDEPVDRGSLVWATGPDGVVRGQGQVRYLEAQNAARLFLMLYADEADDEPLTLHVWDAEGQRTAGVTEALVFEADARRGTVSEPFLLTAETEAYRAAKAAAELPAVYSLSQNYPNPFNPLTQIRYALPEAAAVKLVIFDVLGRAVLTLVDAEMQPGRYDVRLDAGRLASGIYLYRLEAGPFTEVRKMVVMK